jgi:hypothetical protein
LQVITYMRAVAQAHVVKPGSPAITSAASATCGATTTTGLTQLTGIFADDISLQVTLPFAFTYQGGPGHESLLHVPSAGASLLHEPSAGASLQRLQRTLLVCPFEVKERKGKERKGKEGTSMHQPNCKQDWPCAPAQGWCADGHRCRRVC